MRPLHSFYFSQLRVVLLCFSLFFLSHKSQAQSWIQAGETLNASHANFSSGTGLSLSHDGSRLIYSEHYQFTHGNRLTTSIYTLKAHKQMVLHQTDSSQWMQEEEKVDWRLSEEKIWLLDKTRPVKSISQSIDQTVVAFGQCDDFDNGIVSVYHQPFSQSWRQMGQTIMGSGEGEFGHAVDLNSAGDVIAVSAPVLYHDCGIGVVQVFNYSQGKWVKKGEAILGDSGTADWGKTLSLSGDGNILCIGGFLQEGFVFAVYQFDGQRWLKMGSPLLYSKSLNTSQPSVELSRDGKTVVIGTNHNLDEAETVGHVRVLQWHLDQWIEKSQIITGNKSKDDFDLLVRVSADGENIAVLSSMTMDSNKTRLSISWYSFQNDSWVIRGNSIDIIGGGVRPDVSLSMVGDGNSIAVGTVFRHPKADAKIRVFHWNDTIPPPVVAASEPSKAKENPTLDKNVKSDLITDRNKKKACWLRRLFNRSK